MPWSRLDIFDQCLLDIGVIVAVIQRTGAAEKVNIAVTVLVEHLGALGAGENCGEIPAVRTDRRFILFKGLCIHIGTPYSY